MLLDGKVALVTGAASGIGRAIALLLAREGARVAALDIHSDRLTEVVATIRQDGGNALPVRCDVTQPAALEAAINGAAAQWGRLDIVCANAGINGVWAPIEELTLAEWERTLQINLTGTFLTIKYAVPHLKATRGSVVVTSSVNGTRLFSATGASAYAVSKGGQAILTKMLALELAPSGVRVNAVCPGYTDTNIAESTEQRHLEQIRLPHGDGRVIIPLDRVENQPAPPEQIAQVVLFLVSPAAAHVTGTEVWVDGALSLL
jgi:NAD(P)-dependent dehydrogenase (short-subunit alcohol dehydrogenase family)